MAGYVPVLLITANVGSIFEEPSVMLNIWTEEFLSTIARLDPKFIALHCQEVGGKNYEQSMRHVEYFVRLLMSSEELRLFDKVRVFLDEDFSSAEHFTALGNFYFVHESLKDVLLWDFKESTFVPVIGKDVHSGNIEAVTTKEKAKFPQEFFPECKWSRKGFLRTRWSVSGTVFDLINIHLFHDASNFIAMETFPSVYSKTRRRALEHTLDRFHNDQYENVPYFLFGDFNFRTDTAGVIKKLTEDTQESKLPSQNNFSKLQFHNKNDDLVLTLGKKEFSHFEHQNIFLDNSGQWLREYDKELEDFDGRLFEFPINFLPSYPFEENVKEGSNYMQTRVPAWCDRVLLSPTAKLLSQNISECGAVEYGIIGPTTCMGDHKPVYLRIVLSSEAGTVNCCTLANAPQFCFKVPDSYVDTLSMLPDCRSYHSKTSHNDNSANFLHAVPIKHDPYTPDSMDSPSPRALIISGDLPHLELLIDDCNEEEESYFNENKTRLLSSASKRIDTAVSPALLKSKLELIVQSKELNSVKSDMRIKKSPSECDVHNLTTINNDTQFSNMGRKNRSNSDVSWQRSHLLTKAWIQGKGNQSYDYFKSNPKCKSFSSSDSNGINEPSIDRVIPKISIITPSNFESNESSVNLHDDRHSSYSDTRLTTYSDNRTKTISGEASSLEKSGDICDNIFDFGRNYSLDDANIKAEEKFDFLENIKLKEESESRDNNNYNVNMENRDNEILKSLERDRNDKIEEIIDKELMNVNKNLVNDNNSEIKASIIPKIYESQTSGLLNSVINDNVNMYGTTCNAALINESSDLSRCEHRRRRDVFINSRNTTRSNSSQSQDANVALELNARRVVTEICKNDIANENGKCRRCCCVIS